MKDLFSPRNIFLILIVFAGTSTRLLPHPYNFTAISAIALLSGARFNNKLLAFLVPLSAMLLTDVIIGFHAFWDMVAVYGCIIFTGILGMQIKNKHTIFPIAASSLLASTVFYLVTNFSVWPGNALYSQDLTGLLNSYFAGIPFFKNEISGGLFYSTVIFGGFLMAEKLFPAQLSLNKIAKN